MLKIGLLSPMLPEKDGIAIYSDNILRGSGNRDNFVTVGREGSDADYIVDFRSMDLKNNLEKIIKRENLDLIHIQYVASFFGRTLFNYNLIKALKLSVPVVVTLHEVHYNVKRFKDLVLRFIERYIVNSSAGVIVHTPKQKRYLKSNNVYMIYHGLRLNKTPVRKKGKQILCFGMISKGKGLQYLIRAMKYLPSFRLLIAGNFTDISAETEVKEELRTRKDNIRTDFRWIDENKKEEYFRKANIVVLPHLWAPYQSGILHNSVAWNIPVVVTRVGALFEMVDLFKFGEIVRPGNSKDLADGIRKVFNNYDKYGKGLKEYRQEASWKRVVKEHMELYKKVSTAKKSF